MNNLLVLAALIAYGAAECNDIQRIRVKEQWSQLYSEGDRRTVFNTAVFKRFFELKPAAVALFDHVNGKNIYSPNFRAHMARVMTGVDMCLSLLDGKDVLAEELQHLNTQHKSIAGSGDHINELFQALMDVVAATDIRCFDQDAWSGCLNLVGTAMFA